MNIIAEQKNQNCLENDFCSAMHNYIVFPDIYNHCSENDYMIKIPTLCACGCGEVVWNGNQYVKWHNKRGTHHSEDTKQKIGSSNSISLKGKHCSPRTEFKKGLIPWNKDKKYAPESIEKMREAHKGKNPWNKGKKASEEAKRNQSISHLGQIAWNKGMKMPDEIVQKMSEVRIGLQVGEKNPNWRGGTSFYPYCPKFNNAKKEEIRERYGRRCFLCGIHESEIMSKRRTKHHVHHVDYNRLQGCENHEWKLVPLCNSCHSKTNNNHELWELKIKEKLKSLEVDEN